MAIVDDRGTPLADGEVGHIAVRAPDPAMFVGYWNNPAATRAKFADDWLLTGDLGTREDGYYAFIGRDDDVITSAGYRIGPAPIENCLARHPAVHRAAVIGKKDRLRTQIVKAYIVLAAGVAPSEALAEQIKDHVKRRLAAHEYPREVVFIDALPQTATGKIMRHALRQTDADEADP